MSFNGDALSLGLLAAGVRQMTVDVVDSPPRCFTALPHHLAARSAAVIDLLVRDLDDALPSDRSPSNAEHQLACRQVTAPTPVVRFLAGFVVYKLLHSGVRTLALNFALTSSLLRP